MKKKWLVLAGVLGLCMVAAGCGGGDKSKKAADKETEAVDVEEKDSGAGAEDTKEAKDEEPEEPAKEAEPYVKGTVTDNVYESSWLNTKVTLPEDLLFLSDEEKESVEETGEANMNEEGQAAVANADNTSVYELIASNVTQDFNATLLTEDSPMANITPDQYLEAVKSNLQSFTTDEMDYTFSEEITTVTIGGQEYQQMSTNVVYMDVNMHQDYCTRKQDNKIITWILVYTDDTAATKDAFLASVEAIQ
jgi:hypothetical protein